MLGASASSTVAGARLGMQRRCDGSPRSACRACSASLRAFPAKRAGFLAARRSAACHASGLVAFVGAEFCPHGQMVGHLQRLVQRQVKLPHHVEHARTTEILGGRRLVDQQVVVQTILPGIGVHPVNQRRDARNLGQTTQMQIVGVEVAQHDDVVFVCAPHGAPRDRPPPTRRFPNPPRLDQCAR